jgi:hypothetical protein
MERESIDLEVERIRARATALAGTTGDLIQRASVYHHLYADSGRNHSFPLLAAHGALWASGYFRAGMRFGAIVANGRRLIGDNADQLKSMLTSFAEQFRDINRRVCIETFFIYQLTADPKLIESAERLVSGPLLLEMDRCHHAKRTGRPLPDTERRELFKAFFLWEQANIVGPSIEQAFATFDWPLIRSLALRPKIRFSYFNGTPLTFRNFNDTNERIEKGIAAFDRASDKGWLEVERALDDYLVMPHEFMSDPGSFFSSIQRSVDARLDLMPAG